MATAFTHSLSFLAAITLLWSRTNDFLESTAKKGVTGRLSEAYAHLQMVKRHLKHIKESRATQATLQILPDLDRQAKDAKLKSLSDITKELYDYMTNYHELSVRRQNEGEASLIEIIFKRNELLQTANNFLDQCIMLEVAVNQTLAKEHRRRTLRGKGMPGSSSHGSLVVEGSREYSGSRSDVSMSDDDKISEEDNSEWEEDDENSEENVTFSGVELATIVHVDLD